MRDYASILSIFTGSDGGATKALYDDLEAMGAAGIVAVNLFRAAKNSGRAKEYRSGRSRRAAYDTKNWALENLCAALVSYAIPLGLVWGWKLDPRQEFHNQVLYVDLPSGQVSFHSAYRIADCPDYAGDWDGVRNEAPTRICRHVAGLFLREGI